MGRPDHFHCQYLHHGEYGDIEGGFTGYPEGFNDWSYDRRQQWWHDTCVAWGMPEAATIVGIQLAG